MTKLTYIDDQQLINDAARKLIELHLHWSGSNEDLPSRDIGRVRSEALDAYREGVTTFDKWLEMDEAQRDALDACASLIFEKAATLADRKWLAAMTLLGIEQQ